MQNTSFHDAPQLCVGALVRRLAPRATPSPQADYPRQMLRIVVPYPGRRRHRHARAHDGLQAAGAWGQKVIVDNKPGASGTIGDDMVAQVARPTATPCCWPSRPSCRCRR